MKNVRRKSQGRLSLFGSRRGRRGAVSLGRRSSFRPLGAEMLEDRKLLAADVLTNIYASQGISFDAVRPSATPYQNPVVPTDVDGSGRTDVKDLLVEINALRNQGPGSLLAGAGEGEGGSAAAASTTFIDVNGDNMLSMRDALDLISALRGEGEDGPVLKITPEILDPTTLEPIDSVEPGEQFVVRVSSDDLREGMVPDTSLGAVSLAFEVVFPDNVGAEFNSFAFPLFPADQFNPNVQPFVIYDTFGGLVQNPTEASPGVIEVNLVFSITALGAFGNGANQVDPEVLGFNLPVVDLRFTASAAVGGLDAVDDTTQTQEDAAVNIDVLANDATGEIEFATRYPTFEQNSDDTVANTLPGGGSVPLTEEQMMFGSDTLGVPAAATITNVGTPANGTAVLQSDNSILYTPDDDFFGTDTFTYTISNGSATDTATVTVTVGAVNDPPVAVNDSYSTQEEEQLTRNVLDNDSDVDGDALTVVEMNGAQANVGALVNLTNGTVTLNANGTFTYTPNPGVTDATDTFTYRISDGQATSALATVTIRVGLPNATDDMATVQEDSVDNVVDVTDNDEVNAGQTADIVSVTNPANGTATIVVRQGREVVLYTPDPDFFGTDTFEYTIDDTLGTATGTVTVTVQNVNDPPNAVNNTFTVNEDTTTDFDVLANDSFAPDPQETLRVTNVSTPNQGGTVTIIDNGARVRYTPAANFFGAERFTYTISDGNGGTDTATVTVNVQNVNDPPTANNDSDRVIIAFGARELDVLANDTFLPDPQETLTITQVNTSIAQPGGGQFMGTVEIINGGTAIRYTPEEGATGTFVFEYTISDGNGGTDTARVTLEVVDFVPSTISGQVYVDKDNDGLVDAGVDLGLSGVEVMLSGTDFDGEPYQAIATTDAQGRYTFTDVPPTGPNGFEITVAPISFMVDGKETASTTATNNQGGPAPDGYSAEVTGNNEITVHIPVLGDVRTLENNFAVRGLDPQYVSLADIVAQGSQYRSAGLAVVDETGGMGFMAAPTASGWSAYSEPVVTLSADGLVATITATRLSDGVEMEATVPVNTVLNSSGAHIRVIGVDATTGDQLVRIYGSPEDFGLSAVGEGEADDFAQAADAVFAAGF